MKIITKEEIEKRLVNIQSVEEKSCVIASTAMFLAHNFLEKKLSEKTERKIVDLFNDYYKTSLSVDDLHKFFQVVFVLPNERQAILEPLLKNFIHKHEDYKESPKEEEFISYQQEFVILGKEFDFAVSVYSEDRDTEDTILQNPSTNLIFRPYFNKSRFDLIMENEKSASAINETTWKTTQFDVIKKGSGDEDEFKKGMKELLEKYAPQPLSEPTKTSEEIIESQIGNKEEPAGEEEFFKIPKYTIGLSTSKEQVLPADQLVKDFTDRLKELEKIADNFTETNKKVVSDLVKSLQNELEKLSRTFITEQNVSDFKENCLKLITEKIPTIGHLSAFTFGFFGQLTEEEQHLKTSLEKMNEFINGIDENKFKIEKKSEEEYHF